MKKVEGMANGDVEEDQGVSAVLGDGGSEIGPCIKVELREGGMHAVEFAVEAGEIGFRIPGGERVILWAVDIRYYSSPGRNHPEKQLDCLNNVGFGVSAPNKVGCWIQGTDSHAGNFEDATVISTIQHLRSNRNLIQKLIIRTG